MLSFRLRLWPLLAVFALVFLLITILVHSVRAATAVSIQTPTNFDQIYVNFSNATTVPPGSYLRDHGEAYAVRTGTYQGDGIYSYGWVEPGTSIPRNLNGFGVRRTQPADVRLASFMHMQPSTPGSWEIALPDGMYSVTVAAGDSQQFTSRHWLSIESQAAIVDFVGESANQFMTATEVVWVNDGRLTLHASNGSNTKINYVDIISTTMHEQRPSVLTSSIAHAQMNVPLDASITISMDLPNGPIDPTTVTTQTVWLRAVMNNDPISATVSTSQDGDALLMQPTAPLDGGVTYFFEVTDGIKDISGAAVIPFRMFFTTDNGLDPNNGPVAFAQTLVYSGEDVTTLALGPDGKLYAGTLTGLILRFDINADGTLANQQTINTVQTANSGNRTILGMAFDPDATAENLILWISNNHPGLSGVPDWAGKISRLTGENLENIADILVNLPRSSRDHMTNGLAFGPDGALYFLQGSNSAMGAPDSIWGNRPERLLTAAVLRLDVTAVITPPLSVQTGDGGTYDPFAPGAPLTIYASGTRNPYDLVWHSNGRLYVPTNGSAAGGNTPGTPSPLPTACQTRRLDLATNGIYTGPQVIQINNVTQTQNDYLFRVEEGGYYGHPNPERCEWVMNGGNPTTGLDTAEVTQYPLGTQPDRNWRGAAFDFGRNVSPNGVLEYQADSFGGYLQGKLLVVRYSQPDDIAVLTPGQPDGDIVASQYSIPGFTGLSNPLDIVENPANGHLYVSSIYSGRIRLLRPIETDVGLHKTVNVTTAVPQQIITYTITISNDGPIAATNVVVTDVLPAELSLTHLPPGCIAGITCTIPSLAAGQIMTFAIGAQVMIEEGTITNTAVMRHNRYDLELGDEVDTAVVTVIPAHDLQIGMEGADLLLWGSDIQYTLTITNAGPSLAAGVVVTDVLPDDVTLAGVSPGCVVGAAVVCMLGDMAMGQTAVLTLTVTPTMMGLFTNTAVVTGDKWELAPANNEAALETRVALISNLSIHKTASSDWLFVTEPLTYTLLVTNSGPLLATGVVVTDALPVGMSLVGASADCAGTAVVVCGIGELAVGETAVFTITATPTTTGILTNTAVVRGLEFDNDEMDNEDEVATAVLPVTDLAITKLGSSDWLYLGEVLTYTLIISNGGLSPATGVVVTDSLPADVTVQGVSSGCVPETSMVVCAVNALTVNEMATFTITVTPTMTGVLTNTAVVQGDEFDADTMNNEDGVVTAVLPAADLSIAKLGSSEWLYLGEMLTYTLIISNGGPSPATGVVVTDSLPTDLLVEGMSADCVVAIGVVVCDKGDLVVGETAVFTITVTPTTTGVLTNMVVVQGGEDDTNETNNEDSVVTAVFPVTDLAITKLGSSDWLYVGERLTYTLVISNEGLSTATGVVVTDSLPANVTLTGSSPACVPGAGVVTCGVGDLAANETAVLTLTVTPTTTGILTNTAVVQGNEFDADETNNQDEVMTAVLPTADLAITKSGSSDWLYLGEWLTYTLVISNDGLSTATGVVVTDSLPAEVIIQSMSANCVSEVGVVVCGIGQLAVNETAVVTITVVPTMTGILTNTAVVQGHEFDADETNNQDEVVTAVLPVTDLSIAKLGSSEWLYLGEVLTYTLVISNNGLSPATGVVVTDTLPAGLTVQGMSAACTVGTGVVLCDGDDLEVGETAVYTITVTPTTSGILTNTAVVQGHEFDAEETNNEDEVATAVFPLADVALEKRVSQAEVTIGQWLTYTVMITNEGPAVATGILVTDTLPANVLLVHLSPECHGVLVVVCEVDEIAVGATALLTFTVRPITTGIITNTAHVTAREYDPISSNNAMSVTASVLSEPFFVVLDGPTEGMVGQVMTFTAVAGPLTTTQPIAYIWQAVGQPTIMHTAGLTDEVSFVWDEAGEWVVWLTAVNAWGTVTAQQTVTIIATPIHHIYMPIVVRQE